MLIPEKTLCAYLYERACREPDKRLLGDGSGWMTARELMSAVTSLAEQLRICGVRPGEPVALHAVRNTRTVTALFALRLLGAVAVMTDPHNAPEVTLQNCAEPLPANWFLFGEPDGFLLRGQDGEQRICPQANPLPADFSAEGDPREPGFVIFTSGSTGKSKAVTLCDRNFAANLLDSAPIGDYREADIALGVLPMDHVFGLVLTAGIAILGYAMYMPARTDLDGILTAIETEHITRMNGVPSLYAAMAAMAPSRDLGSLRAGFIGGAPVTREQFTAMERALDMTLIPVYGMSECIGVACADYRDSTAQRCGNVGRVYSLNTVRILDEGGREVPQGATGEIWVRGPARMLGYWRHLMNPEAFFPTGDLGYLTQEGYLVIAGRKKEIIIRNGNNLSPVAIETALLSLPGVRAAVVVGLPDDRQGEVPYAMVAGACDGGELAPLLPKNALPAGILCVDALPMTASGKPDKMKIRDILLQWRGEK